MDKMIKLNFFKKAFDLNKYKNHRCVFCGSDKKILTGEKTIPDFDPKTIQKKIRTKFLTVPIHLHTFLSLLKISIINILI